MKTRNAKKKNSPSSAKEVRAPVKTKPANTRTKKHKDLKDQKQFKEKEELFNEVEANLYIMKDSEDGVRGMDFITNELIEFSMHAMNTKVRRMYTTYQNKYITFMRRNKCTDYLDDEAMVAFLEECSNVYAPTTLWVIYSCVNKMFILNWKENLNNWPRVRDYMKAKTLMYVAKKAATFTAEEIDDALTHYTLSDDHHDRLAAMHIILSYFGLLRLSDVLKVQKKDLSWDRHDRCWKVTFEYSRKRKNPGFCFLIPKKWSAFVTSYFNEVDDIDYSPTDHKVPPRFLRNYHKVKMRRQQNAGENNLSQIAKATAELVGLDPTHYSNHSWRRSAATNLADRGVSLTNLKRMGQWQSDKVAEGYIACSRPLRLERMMKLLPEGAEDIEVKMKDPPQDEKKEDDVAEDTKTPARNDPEEDPEMPEEDDDQKMPAKEERLVVKENIEEKASVPNSQDLSVIDFQEKMPARNKEEDEQKMPAKEERLVVKENMEEKASVPNSQDLSVIDFQKDTDLQEEPDYQIGLTQLEEIAKDYESFFETTKAGDTVVKTRPVPQLKRPFTTALREFRKQKSGTTYNNCTLHIHLHKNQKQD